MFAKIADRIIEKASQLVNHLAEIQALGISGSGAQGGMDAFSDVDICIFVEGEYPHPKVRQETYAAIGFAEPIYFDVDFDTSRGDGFQIEGMRCDFNWMVIEKVREFLSELESDFGCTEWLPGGLATVKAMYDPQDVIPQLQNEIPAYSVARARYRVQQALREIHFSLYGLGWLPKAARRNDAFSFLKYQTALFEKLFYALYALNRVWYADEKHLTERIMRFDTVPKNAGERIEATILHTQDRRDLEHSLHEIKALCADTAQIARQRYPDLDLPLDWA
jgi:hypothetical protein